MAVNNAVKHVSDMTDVYYGPDRVKASSTVLPCSHYRAFLDAVIARSTPRPAPSRLILYQFLFQIR